MPKVSVLSFSGVCAILYTVAIGGLFALMSRLGALEPVDTSVLLANMTEHQEIAAGIGWLLVLAPMLLAIVGLGLFLAVRESGPWMWVALMAFSGGGFLIVYRGAVYVALAYKLAPAYVAASESSQSTLAGVADTLIVFASVADYVGAALIAGTGLPIFSYGILQTKFASKWVAWLGFFAAVVGGWLTLLGPISELIQMVSFIGFVAFIVWLIVMGIVLLRAAKPGEPDSISASNPA